MEQQGFDNLAGFFRAATSQFNQRPALRYRSDYVVGSFRKDLFLGSRQVILVDATDGFEELRAKLVVEMFREELFGMGREAAANVPGKIREPVLARQIVND